jgi:hypothetical protein
MRYFFRLFFALFLGAISISPALACKKCDVCTHRCGAVAKIKTPDLSRNRWDAAAHFWLNETNLPDRFKVFVRRSFTTQSPVASGIAMQIPKGEVVSYKQDGDFVSEIGQFIQGNRLILSLDNFRPKLPSSGTPVEYAPTHVQTSSQRALSEYVQAILVHLHQMVLRQESAGGFAEIQVIVRNIQGTELAGAPSPYDRMLKRRFGFQEIPGTPGSKNYFLTVAIKNVKSDRFTESAESP